MKTLLAILVSLVLASPAFAGGVVHEIIIPVLSGTTSITGIPDDCQSGIIQHTLGDDVRFGFGKATISNSHGAFLELGDWFVFKSHQEMQAFRATVDSAGSGASLYFVGFGYREDVQ